MERTREFRENILKSDIIIYDLVTNTYEEVDYVVDKLSSVYEGLNVLKIS